MFCASYSVCPRLRAQTTPVHILSSDNGGWLPCNTRTAGVRAASHGRKLLQLTRCRLAYTVQSQEGAKDSESTVTSLFCHTTTTYGFNSNSCQSPQCEVYFEITSVSHTVCFVLKIRSIFQTNGRNSTNLVRKYILRFR